MPLASVVPELEAGALVASERCTSRPGGGGVRHLLREHAICSGDCVDSVRAQGLSLKSMNKMRETKEDKECPPCRARIDRYTFSFVFGVVLCFCK